jgi:hypothetical protein
VPIRFLAPVLALALAAGGCGGDDDGRSKKSAANQGNKIAKQSATEDGQPKAYEQSGGLVADSGFRPEKDGFGFENYTFGFEDLGPAQMEALRAFPLGATTRCDFTKGGRAAARASQRLPSPDSSSTARNASWGTSILPTCFMRFLPAFCFSSSLRLRVTSPP